jgi:hypothetical protein
VCSAGWPTQKEKSVSVMFCLSWLMSAGGSVLNFHDAVKNFNLTASSQLSATKQLLDRESNFQQSDYTGISIIDITTTLLTIRM